MDSTPKKKKSVPKVVKDHAWNRWIGDDIAKSKCFCCGLNEIKMNSFHCGHVVAEVNGGKTTVDNLRPICASCNLSMGTDNLDDFKVRCGFTAYPVESTQEPVLWTPGCLRDTLPKILKWQPGTNSIEMSQDMAGRYTYNKEKSVYVLNNVENKASADTSNRKFVVTDSGNKVFMDTLCS